MLIRQPHKIKERDFIKTFAISLKPEYSDWTEEIILDKLENEKGFDINSIIENKYYIVNQNDKKYSEAEDPAEFDRRYTETDEVIPVIEDDNERISRLERTVNKQTKDIKSNIDDIEAIAEGVQELAEIIGGGE